MARRFAGCLALLTFAVCIVAGLSAGNTAATVLSNALATMGASFVVGLAVGAMAQKMLDENVAAHAAKAEAASKGNLENPERIPEPRGR
jgi:threonine/homoserine/homoserine lactone efflux protein